MFRTHCLTGFVILVTNNLPGRLPAVPIQDPLDQAPEIKVTSPACRKYLRWVHHRMDYLGVPRTRPAGKQWNLVLVFCQCDGVVDWKRVFIRTHA